MLNIVVGPIIVGLIVGAFVWFLGQRTVQQRDKKEAIRDLMTYRGDYSSNDFRRSLNRVSITFHGDEGTRKQIRELNEMINSPESRSYAINRKIVGLIYDLCQRNGFKGITEYDIDLSFPEQKQAPTAGNNVPLDENPYILNPNPADTLVSETPGPSSSSENPSDPGMKQASSKGSEKPKKNS